MTFAGFALVLAAACCHATWNLFLKRINGGAELVWLFSLLSVVLYGPLVLWVLANHGWALTPMQWLFVCGSGLLHLGYFFLLQAGYRHGDLSLVYPIARASGPLLASVFAVLFLGEVLTLPTALGAGLIVFGVLMMTGGLTAQAKHVSRSLVFALGVGALIGSYTAWDAYAVSVLLVPPLIQEFMGGFFRLVLLAPTAYKKREVMAKQWRDHRLGVILIGIFNPLAYILVLYAMTFTPVIYIAPMREVSVVLTVLAGSIILGEGKLRQRLTWASVIFAGMLVLMTA